MTPADQVRSALPAIADHAGHWTFVSTGSVYADNNSLAGADESTPLLPPLTGDAATAERPGEGNVPGEVP